MKEIISSFPILQKTDVYTDVMGNTDKSLQKEPSEFGRRIAEARLRAGLTQVEWAKRLGVTRQVVAAWERRDVALRAEQIRTLAEALGTTADYLIGIAANWKGTKGPSGKVRQVFEQVSKLPRRQQEKVVEFVEAFVRHKAAAGKDLRTAGGKSDRTGTDDAGYFQTQCMRRQALHSRYSH